MDLPSPPGFAEVTSKTIGINGPEHRHQGAIALAENAGVSHAKSKNIDIRHHFIRDAATNKIIRLH